MGKPIEKGRIVVDDDYGKEVQEHVVVDDDGNEVELRFLVRGLAVEDAKLYDRAKYRDLYRRYDYYEVDLNRFKSGQVLVPCCHPLMSSLGVTGTVRIDSKIFTVGYLFRPVDEILDSVEFMGETVDCLKCVASVDLNDDHPRKWKQASPPIVNGLGYECAALGGRVYCLHSEYLDQPLVYVPEDDKWSIVSGAIPPTQYHECTISPKIIPDPTNNRILLHLCRNGISPGIYAWYPHCSHVVAAPPYPPHSVKSTDSPPNPRSVGSTDYLPNPRSVESTDSPPDPHSVESTDSSSEFPENSTNSPTPPLSPSLECVCSDLTSRTWRKKTTLAQGMLFFYSRKFIGLIKVLDLETNKWVRVKWPSPPPALSHHPKAKSMFYLGNGHLCLAVNGFCTTPCFGSRMYFYLLHFHRSDDSSVIISHRFTKYFDAHGLHYAEDFVPLGDISC